ncbi:MAG: hypothetical protein RMK52_01805 [Chitinophagales bacterium]|nr:hypothetical protein [Chitinophagales bacterium]
MSCWLLLTLLCPFFSYVQHPAQWVNPFIGTGGHGHTFPIAVSPLGMMQSSPDTRADNSWDGCSAWRFIGPVGCRFEPVKIFAGQNTLRYTLLASGCRPIRLDFL